MQVAVLGAGSWGTAPASVLSQNKIFHLLFTIIITIMIQINF